MNKDSLLKELKNFLKSDYNIILLDGPWGSGKTFLLHQLIESESNVKYYYVSLHGMKNIDEINTSLFLKAHPDAKNITNLIPSVINPFGEQSNTKSTLEYLLKINKLNADKIVILDDLERYASSDYDSFLSYLTSLIGAGAKVIVVSNLLDFGTSELYLFNQYKEKIFDRIYKAQLFSTDTINNKFNKYAKHVDDTIILLAKNNYRIIEKIVNTMDEFTLVFAKHNIKLNDDVIKNILYYVSMFVSTYYESAKSYLNKVCIRLSVSQEKELKELLKNDSAFQDVNLICIEHLNLKAEKPVSKNDYLIFEAIYEAYMYCEYDRLLELISNDNF